MPDFEAPLKAFDILELRSSLFDLGFNLAALLQALILLLLKAF